jgi:ATP-dependent 26S proteasome regulatory subunit
MAGGPRVFGNQRLVESYAPRMPVRHQPARALPPADSSSGNELDRLRRANQLLTEQLASAELDLERRTNEAKTFRQELERVRAVEGPFGPVVRIVGNRATSAVNGHFQTFDCSGYDLEVGDAIRLAPPKEGNRLHVVEVIKQPLGACLIVTVSKLHPPRRNGDALFEYTDRGAVRTCRVGKLNLAEGDRVMIEPEAQIAVQSLGQEKVRTFSHDTGVSWDDIGGLEDVKRELKEAIEDPVTYKELFAAFGHKPAKGILLHGPPGTGKTMLAKACATSMARMHGDSFRDSGFIFSKGPDVLDKFLGESEAAVRKMFEAARRHKKEHGYSAILFIDEADAILGRRGNSQWEGMLRTIVPMFLAEMDGLDETGALVLLTTNRPDMLDPAVIRDGRIDRRILVPNPSLQEAMAIVKIHLRGRPLESEELANKIVERLSGKEVSGAQLAGAVQRVVAHALRRAKGDGVAKVLVKDVEEAALS